MKKSSLLKLIRNFTISTAAGAGPGVAMKVIHSATRPAYDQGLVMVSLQLPSPG